MKRLFFILILLSSVLPFQYAGAQDGTLVEDKVEIVRAKVIEVLNEEEREIVGTDVTNIYQTLKIEILSGEKAGEIITMENDYIPLEKGDKFFLRRSVDWADGTEMYAVRDVDRRGVMIGFVLLFVAVILFFSGKQGFMSILSLAGSFFVILYILLPSLLKGYPPVLTSVLIASIILFLAIFLTHGFNRVSIVAFTGTVISVAFTGVLAYLAVYFARLTGFSSDEAVYLNFSTNGTLNFSGLLLGGIMIGVLGVLDDIAVTQAAVVNELYGSSKDMSGAEVYKKALRVGREHIGALVNTLAFAYTGASLPLLLLFSTSSSSVASIINQEVFVTEIIRTTVGSIGLILTVPITTLLAVKFLKNNHSGSSIHSHHIS